MIKMDNIESHRQIDITVMFKWTLQWVYYHKLLPRKSSIDPILPPWSNSPNHRNVLLRSLMESEEGGTLLRSSVDTR